LEQTAKAFQKTFRGRGTKLDQVFDFINLKFNNFRNKLYNEKEARRIPHKVRTEQKILHQKEYRNYNIDLNNVNTIYDETPIYDKTWIQKRISLIIQFNSTISTMTTIQILKYEISHRQQKPGLKQIQDQYF